MMFETSNIWSVTFLLGVVFVIAWLLYPPIYRLIRSLVASHKIDDQTKVVKSFLKPGTAALFIVVGLAMAGFAFWRTVAFSQSNPRPPDFVAVQQEFKRYEKARQRRQLDETWQIFALKQEVGWVDSGFDFSPGDYFWVLSYDSCAIKLQPFGADTTLMDTIATACYQSAVTQQTAVSLKVLVKEPPLYYNDSTNVFVKHWSKPEAQSAQYTDLVLSSSLFFLAALLIPLGLQLGVETKRGVESDYYDRARHEKADEDQARQDEKRRRDCRAAVERYRLRVMKVGVDTFKEYLEAKHLKDHYATFLERGDVVGYLERLIEEGIYAKELELILEEILEGAPTKEKKPQEERDKEEYEQIKKSRQIAWEGKFNDAKGVMDLFYRDMGETDQKEKSGEYTRQRAEREREILRNMLQRELAKFR